jgi:hypothetical protein
MTFYHFVNCMALACVPFHLVYKYSGLAEYGAFWKCVTAGLVYMVTQLAKMLFLATFFPSGDDEFDESSGAEAAAQAAAAAATAATADFDFLTEFLKLTVDLADLVGLHMIMQRFVAGKGTVKILVAGVGWAFAEFLLTRVIFLWVGARGIEFDWKYIQKSLDSNVSLVHYLTLATLVWLFTRRDALVVPGNSSSGGSKQLEALLLILMAVCSYKTLLLDTSTVVFELGAWSSLGVKAVSTALLGTITMQIYSGITTNYDK